MNRCAAVVVAFAASFAIAGTGRISGTVVDEHGVPVKQIVVGAIPFDMGISGGGFSTGTDEHGHFTLNVPVGREPDGHSYGLRWDVYLKGDEKLGFPDKSSRFYHDDNDPPQIVDLTPESPEAHIDLKLGPRAGVLVGTVADATTGAPLNPCAEFSRVSDPYSIMGGSGLVKAKYRMLVPPNADVKIKVWQDGYKLWYYPGTVNESGSRPLRLKPGEERTLDIRLQPDSSRTLLGCGMPVGTVVGP